MRRGHPGIGGWRSENPRPFRPRNSGPPRFRPSRTYPLLESPRFPPPNPRVYHRGAQHFNNTHVGEQDEYNRSDSRDRRGRDGHRHVNQRSSEREQHHQIPPLLSSTYLNNRQNDNQSSSYDDRSMYHGDVAEPCRVNSMGDIDHRQTPRPHSQSYSQPRITMWMNPPNDSKKHYYEKRSPQKSYRHHEPVEGSRIPVVDYTGHRPPSSDHYGGTSGPATNNNNTSFSRSVDDTVDIVRRRLMHRTDPHRRSQDTPVHRNDSEQEVRDDIRHETQQEQPAKKRTPRHRPNVKSNCDKMKTNIVHQLFKMDKDKIHKLMDNPSSSSKFEYAISSLITESQNSLNRQLRSVAEKSLYSSSSDFIHNDNNTIYEDTFMKQVQCLFDPQDTIFLEDLKPIVMAELSKVLELDDDVEQRYDGEDMHQSRDDHSQFPYQYDQYNYDDYAPETPFGEDQLSISNFDNQRRDVTDSAPINDYNNYDKEYDESKPLFQRRPTVKTEIDDRRHSAGSERRSIERQRHSIERQRHSMERHRHSVESHRNSVESQKLSAESERHRRSTDKPVENDSQSRHEELPLFSASTDQVSEDENTFDFTELDNQYHVAVDHSMIDDDMSRLTPTESYQKEPEPPSNIKTEVIEPLSMAKSPIDLLSDKCEELQRMSMQIKHEVMQSLSDTDFSKENTTPSHSENSVVKTAAINVNEQVPYSSNEMKKSDSSNISKTPSPRNSRKRSADQRPSHRKEKRKKSESSQSDTPRSSSDKHINIANDSHTKITEKCNDAPNPNLNTSAAKDDNNKEAPKDNKKRTPDKNYSDKYVKRKDSSKERKPKEREKETEKETESGRKRHSSTSSQTILSPKDSTSSNSQTPTKLDSKTKFKTFDMFVELPKKSSAPHQAHRNTSSAVTVKSDVKEDSKSKGATTPARNKNVQTKQVGTQVIRRLIAKETQTQQTKAVTTRFCQTERKRLIAKQVQTDPISFEKSKPKSSDAFERMKEIDMEIQELLQEKFKLYSSLESKDTCPSSMPSLGMTVLNVTPVDESKGEDEMQDNIMSADAIVDEFTNIPVEELEQIALESVQEECIEDKKKRSVRQKVLNQERKSSQSPTSSRRNTKKAKPPNISLIEQIITDDRPLEDIISLDDLEEVPSKTNNKKKSKPASKKKNSKKKPVKKVANTNTAAYDIKECSVIIKPITDISKFMKEHYSQSEASSVGKETPVSYNTDSMDTVPDVEVVNVEKIEPIEVENQVEETVVSNDLQFDMLDVSEDIVIGDNCEVKSNEDKEERVPISEEIILDNSQSSVDDVLTAESGQHGNECRMFDYSTDEQLLRDSVTVTGNADAVLAIECIENDFIAACLDGNVYHFNGEGQLLNTLRGSNLAVTCLTIVKERYGTTVYTGSLDSRIRYYDLETGLEKGPECNVLSPIQTMDRAWDTVFVGTRTGFVLQFECKNNMLIPVSTVKFSEQSILALRAIKEGPRKVLLVAARSENVTIKDAQTGLLLRTLAGPKMTVYTLLFEDGKVFCGTSSHQIHVFDYASGSHTGCHSGGKGAVCLRAWGGLLFAGCYDGCVYVYREGEPRPLAQLRGPSLMLLSLAVVGSKIIAGYKDRSLYIWKIPLSILQEMIL